jgi:hypothetical protein
LSTAGELQFQVADGQFLLTCIDPEFAAFPPGQIVVVLADRGSQIDGFFRFV